MDSITYNIENLQPNVNFTLNLNPKEEFFFKIEKKLISENNYGLIYLDDKPIPPFTVIAELECISSFQLTPEQTFFNELIYEEYWSNLIHHEILKIHKNLNIPRNNTHNTDNIFARFSDNDWKKEHIDGMANIQRFIDMIDQIYPRNISLSKLTISRAIRQLTEDVSVERQFWGQSFIDYYANKIRYNIFDIGNNRKGLFNTPSFMNHKCEHNIFVYPHPDKSDSISLISAKEINKGDELTIIYKIGDMQKLKSIYNISCGCQICNDQSKYSYVDYLRSLNKTCCYCYNNSTSLKICGGCKLTRYCSIKCQNSDWKRHKIACNAFKMFLLDIVMIHSNPSVENKSLDKTS